MANFRNAFDITMGHEGRYVNDPDDPGGETYRGISRRNHPSWVGWQTIDSLKRRVFAASPNEDPLTLTKSLKKEIDVSKNLDDYVVFFYREHYWDRVAGNEIQDQKVAEELFDTAVNMGVHKAVTFLQGALNLLNRRQQSYPDIAEDGVMGPTTLKILHVHLNTYSTAPHDLLVVMNILQGMHYITIMRRHPTLEKYARGWFKRVTIGKG